MKLEIKLTDKENIVVKFKNEKCIIAKNSNDWTNEGICKFLTNLAVHTPDGEKIEIDFNKDEQDNLYKHICELFQAFVDEYNNRI